MNRELNNQHGVNNSNAMMTLADETGRNASPGKAKQVRDARKDFCKRCKLRNPVYGCAASIII